MTKLIGLTDLFKNTWTIYREKYQLLFGLMIGPFLLMAISQLLFIKVGGAFASLIGVVACLGILWAGASAIIVLSDRTRPLTIKEAYRLGWGKILPLIWVAILTMVVVGGSYFLFIVPGVILTVWVLFAQILVVTEGEKGMKALVKSREYTRGYFWPILGRYLAIMVGVTIVYIILMIIATAIGGKGIIFELLSAIINLLITPLALVYSYLLYENVKQVKGQVSVDPTKKQGIWFLVVGLAGWALIIIVWVFFFSALLMLMAGLFLGQAIGNVASQPALPAGLPLSPSALPAGMTVEQQKQLQVQMETLKKMQEQLKQLNQNLPASPSGQ